MAAGIADKTGKGQLVKADERHAEQASRRLAKRSLPVPRGSFAWSWLRFVVAAGRVTHGSARNSGG